MPPRFSILALLCVACILLLAGYLAGVSYPDLMPRTFSLQTTPLDPSHQQPGVTINLPAVVAPVDDGQRYYYVQVNLAVELDRSGTAGLIQARHEVIDRKIMEVLHTYSVKELRSAGLRSTLRTDIRRVINQLLPQGHIRNVYITNWLMTPVGP
ncbi:MAG: flagellar basal body-associated protein FliL [Nitrospira sp. OLB3]|nr:MAG: flagellar basal body-associated protein FliL [Nitrospira sp. OLB3]MCE7964693.1 hypothetical protein [Nitrospira sp. NTP2]RIK57984.1 MAG: hypothetical protein DCC63_12515 [Nitrospira sp.]